eukprot:COSAG01_NODE_5406_length_4282_cov_2.946211_5_plen_25_part_01
MMVRCQHCPSMGGAVAKVAKTVLTP